MMSAVPQRVLYTRFGVLIMSLLAGSMFISLVEAGDQEVMSGSIAAAIREAGHPCAHVIQTDRSKEGSAEGLTVWNVRCNSGRFKVTFKGDTGSEVMPLD
jgi:hypothetical protein